MEMSELEENAAAISEDTHHLLIVDDDEAMVSAFCHIAERMNCSCTIAASGKEAESLLKPGAFDVAVIDVNLSEVTGLQLLEQIRNFRDDTEVIMVTGQGSVQSAVKSLKLGAYDYLTKPFEDISHVERTIEKALEKVDLIRRLNSYEIYQGEEFSDIVGKSEKMKQIYKLINNISHSSSNVLIQGESGTGKELVARAIYQNSPRAEKPFVVINCSALAENLLESELFGHVKGAFTGAIQNKKGLFAEANGGTILLDEIGEVPLSMQVKLLRVLQGGEVRPLGADQVHYVDVRVIAATNKDLQKTMRQGLFREDLYYRLNVIGIRLPPLRDRSEDIPLLAQHFLKKYSERAHKEAHSISIDAMQSLQDYRWVGNVRELENVIERAVVLSNSDAITARDLPPKLLSHVFYEKEPGDSWLNMGYKQAKEKALTDFNHKYITGLLQMSRGNISLASQRAGMDRNNFKKIVKKYKINAKTFKKDH
jgi:two-component system response regulator HydG